MAIAFVSKSSVAGTYEGNATVPAPVGVQSGDLLVVLAQTDAIIGATAWTSLSGFTQRTLGVANGKPTIVFTKTATSVEPSSYIWPVGTREARFLILAYRGVAAVVDVELDNTNTQAETLSTFPKVTTVDVNQTVLTLASTDTPGTIVPWTITSSAGTVRDSYIGTGGINFSAHVVDAVQPAAGNATGPSLTVGGPVYWTVTQLALSGNVAPNAPTLTAAGPVNKDATNRLSWTPSDDDAGDSQSAYNLRYRVVGASSWTTVSGSTPNAYRDMVAGTFVAADYEWQVRTYDAAGLVGPWSASSFFTAAAAPAGPAITDPVNGQTIGGSSYLLTWSSPDQEEYEASILDADGAVIFTTGTVSGPEAVLTRSLLLSFPVNSASRTIRLRTRTAGLWSPYASVTVLVSYTTPAVVLASVRPISTIPNPYGATDAILVELLNPAPSGGQPAVGSHRIYRRAGTTGDGIRIVVDHPAGQAYVDRTPASGVDYAYRVESIAANGTTSTSEWITDAAEIVTPGTPGDEGDFADADFATADFI